VGLGGPVHVCANPSDIELIAVLLIWYTVEPRRQMLS
jgi:hypothetical protein